MQDDILFAWNEISSRASEVLQANPKYIKSTKKFETSMNESGEMVSRIKELEMKNKKQILISS